MPRLACMTRMNEFEEDKTITITPLKSFPVIKDIVADVSWNYEQNQKIKPFTPSKEDTEKGFVMMQKMLIGFNTLENVLSVTYVRICVMLLEIMKAKINLLVPDS